MCVYPYDHHPVLDAELSPSSISEGTHSVPLTNYSYDFFGHKLILSVFELHVNGIYSGLFLSVSILRLSIMSHTFFT